jgi:outer membrane protein, heavy metal efflux system
MQSFKIIAVFCALTILNGCAMRRYRPAPLSPAQTAASLKARSLADPGLREFIAKLQSAPATWPLAEWSLADLTLAAFYYNPALTIARGRLSEAEAAIVTAGARPNPSVRADVGGETAVESPWIASLGFSLPIETAGKRRYRISQAERLADVARWDLTSTAWKVRAQVRSAMLEYVTAERNVGLLEDEERLGAEQVALLEQRFAVGIAVYTRCPRCASYNGA